MPIFTEKNGCIIIDANAYRRENIIDTDKENLIELVDENLSTHETVKEVLDFNSLNAQTPMRLFRFGLHRVSAIDSDGQILDCAYFCRNDNHNKYKISVTLSQQSSRTLLSVKSDIYIPVGEMLSYTIDNDDFRYYLTSAFKDNQGKGCSGIPADVKCYFSLPEMDDLNNIRFDENPKYYVPKFEKDGFCARLFDMARDGNREMDLGIEVSVERT